MKEKVKVQDSAIKSVLQMYGINERYSEQKIYIDKQFYNNEIKSCEAYVKLIFSVLLESKKRIVIKILHEKNDLYLERRKIEKQSEFSEFMRKKRS